MKPGDYYIGHRDFFAVLIPGSVWFFAGYWLISGDPLAAAEGASVAHVLAGAFVSYLLGYVARIIIKRFVHPLPRNSRLTSLVRAIPTPRPSESYSIQIDQLRRDVIDLIKRVDPVSSRYVSPGHWSRRAVQERSQHLRDSLPEIETEVEFLGSLVPALLAVVIAMMSRLEGLQLVWAAAPLGFSLLFAWRFLEIRAYEERGWLTKALMLDAFGLLGPPIGEGSVRIAPQTVARFFRANTQVRFNWDRYLDERWPTRLIALTRDAIVGGGSALSTFYLPWYLGDDNQIVEFDDLEHRHDAKPLQLGELRSKLSMLEPTRIAYINALSESFRSGQGVPVTAVLCYSLGPRGVVILDGNHRLAALVNVTCDFSIQTYVIDGPIDSDVLADLAYWVRFSS